MKYETITVTVKLRVPTNSVDRKYIDELVTDALEPVLQDAADGLTSTESMDELFITVKVR